MLNAIPDSLRRRVGFRDDPRDKPEGKRGWVASGVFADANSGMTDAALAPGDRSVAYFLNSSIRARASSA